MSGDSLKTCILSFCNNYYLISFIKNYNFFFLSRCFLRMRNKQIRPFKKYHFFFIEHIKNALKNRLSCRKSGFLLYLISWIIGRIIGLLFVFSKKYLPSDSRICVLMKFHSDTLPVPHLSRTASTFSFAPFISASLSLT